MTEGKSLAIWIAAAALIGLGITLVLSKESRQPAEKFKPAVQPALNISYIQPATMDIPRKLTTNGSIAAWQEAIVGAQVSDLRLDEVRVQVGEKVRKGQVLAVFDKHSVMVEIAQTKAALAEAEASLEEARLNADRARKVAPSGALSNQMVVQYLTGEKTAKAKVASAKAQLDRQLLRLSHTSVVALDDGVISSRTATLGAVATPGQELFRLIRQNRLEWRAEVTAAEMAQLQPGMEAAISVPNVGQVGGKIRYLAPSLDTQTRNGLVYVDLPQATEAGLRAGMFAQGEFNMGNKAALTLPQEALSLREGFSYVFRLGELVDNKAKVTQVKVQLGQRTGGNYEILSGLNPDDKVVASGAAFLADGDSVQVVR
jgi:RND family efflux transporter MFP subunit